MIDRLFRCSCGEVVLKSLNGIVKIRNKVIVFHGDRAFAVCKGCNTEHPIPLRLDRLELLKSVEFTRLFVTSTKSTS